MFEEKPKADAPSLASAIAALDAAVDALRDTTPAIDDGRYSVDYLIVGNSAAGISAAEAIRSVDSEGSILMVSDEPYPAYGRPLISYLLEGKADACRLGYRDGDFYQKNRIGTLFGAEHKVVSLDASAHEAICADGSTVAYGACLLATGSVAFIPEIEGMEGRANVHRFITLDDALGAWADVVEATERAHAEGRESRVVVIGGGLIGMKAAEALSHHADDVVVFERNGRILPAVLDERGAEVMRRLLARRGIACRPGVSATSLLGDGDCVSGVRLTDGSELACDAVIIAVGVRPASGLAVDAGAEQGRGLVVGPDMMTTLSDVYAAGDVTQVADRFTGEKRPLALWPNAVCQGRIAGLHMAGADGAAEFSDSFAVNAVDFYDVSLLTAGVINSIEGDGTSAVVRGNAEEYAKFVVRDGKLVGYVLLNCPDDAGIYTALIEGGVPLSSLGADADERLEAREAVGGDACGDIAVEEGASDGDTVCPALRRTVRNLDFPTRQRWERLHKFYPRNRDEFGRECEEGDWA